MVEENDLHDFVSDTMKHHNTGNDIDVHILCEKLDTKFDSYQSYHVTVSLCAHVRMFKEAVGMLMSSQAWPKGVLVRRFFLKKNGGQNLSLCTYNCRSVKNSLANVRQWCDTHDIALLKEHWLLPFELNILSEIHPDFLATARSAVNVASDLLKGRPYGGTLLWYFVSQKVGQIYINVVDINEPRTSHGNYH